VSAWLAPAPWWLVVAGWSVLIALWHTSVVALAFATWRLWQRAATARRQYLAAALALALSTVLTLATPAILVIAGRSTWLVPPGTAYLTAIVGTPAAVAAARPEPLGGRVRWRATARAVTSIAVPWIGAAWCFGFAAGLLRLGAGWSVALWIRRRATDISSAQLVDAARDAAATWGRPPAPVLASAHVEAPVVIGARAPAVLLPLDLEQRLDAAALQPLLAHELAHVDRRDYAANLLQSFADTLLFFSPGARWLSRRVREAREYCCDDLVAARCGAGAYASALTTLARLGVVARARPAVNAAGPRLIVRIRRLLQEDTTPRFARYRLVGLLAAVALVAAAGRDVLSLSAAAVARANASGPAAPLGARREGTIPVGFLAFQPGSALRLRSMQPTDAGLCGSAEIENLANVAITGVRFASFMHAPAPLLHSDLSVGGVGTSDWLPVDLAPAQIATVDVGLLTEAQAREMLQTSYAQVMCAVAEIRYANGGQWQMSPAAIFGPERADIPRALIGRAETPGESFCRDDIGGEYSEGAVAAVRFEPMTFARCEAGAWGDFQLKALSAGKPFVWMQIVLADGHRPQIGVDPGRLARLDVGAGKWGILPTVDAADERRVRLEIVDLTVDPPAPVADFWTTVGAPPVKVDKASLTVQVSSTRNP
jgi:beta-lactamase regulating signal transducer with metallopeptidase domain